MAREEEIQKHTAEIIRVWRKARKMSQATLAQRLGMHQTAIAKIENSERRVDFVTVMQIAEILEIPWSEFQFEVLDSDRQIEEIAIRMHSAIQSVEEADRNLAHRLMVAREALIHQEKEIHEIVEQGNLDLDKWADIIHKMLNTSTEGVAILEQRIEDSNSVSPAWEKLYASGQNTIYLIKRLDGNASS